MQNFICSFQIRADKQMPSIQETLELREITEGWGDLRRRDASYSLKLKKKICMQSFKEYPKNIVNSREKIAIASLCKYIYYKQRPLLYCMHFNSKVNCGLTKPLTSFFLQTHRTYVYYGVPGAAWTCKFHYPAK